MRYQRDGMRMWWGTEDSPAPSGTVAAGEANEVTIAVAPIDPDYRVELHYQRDGGETRRVPARWAWSSRPGNTMYFRAALPALEPGERLAYGATCRCGADELPAEPGPPLPTTLEAPRPGRARHPARRPASAPSPAAPPSAASAAPAMPPPRSATSAEVAASSAAPAQGLRRIDLGAGATLTVSSKLMDNYEAVQPIDNQKAMVSATAADGTVLLFAIGAGAGAGDHVFLLRKDPGSSRGWSRIDLSADLGPGYRALQLAAAQDAAGRPILAAAFEHPAHPGKVFFFHTRDFDARPAPARWVARGSVVHDTVRHIATGHGFGDEVLIVVTAQVGREVHVYRIDAGPGSPNAPWRRLPFNIDSTGILTTAIGHLEEVRDKTDLKRRGNPSFPDYRGNAGTVLYTLTHLDGDTVLYLKGLEDDSYNHVVRSDEPIRSMALGRTARGFSDCFLGSTRLYHLDARTQRQTRIATTGALHGESFEEPIRQIVVNPLAGGRFEAWALLDNGFLNYTQEAEPGAWTVPLTLQKEVTEVASHRDPATGSLELYPVDLDSRLYHLWRDPRTTRWQSREIDLEDTGRSERFQSYVTQLKLTDALANPLAGEAVRVHASELTALRIDDRLYFVGPHEDEGVEVMADNRGVVSLTNKIGSLSSPHFLVGCRGKVIEVAPIEEVKNELHERLRGGPQALLAEKVQEPDGTTRPLLRGKYATRAAAEAAHAALTQLLSVTRAAPQPTHLARLEMRGDRVLRGFANRIDASGMATWTLDLRGGAPRWMPGHHPYQPGALDATAVAGTAISGSVLDAFGDFFKAVLDDIREVEHLVVRAVENGLELIVNGIVHLVVEFVEQVWTAIDWLFRTLLGVSLDDLLKWLGFIFNWRDILDTKKALEAMVDQGLDRMIGLIESAEPRVRTFFDDLETRLVGPDLAAKLGAHGSRKASDARGPADVVGDLLTGGNPAIDWIFNQVSKIHLFSGIKGEVPGFGNETHTVGDILGRLVLEELGDVGETVEAVVLFVAHNFQRLSVEELLLEILKILGAGALEMAKDAVLALLDLAAALLRQLKAVLHRRWNVPILSPLYKKFVDPGQDLSLLELTTLVFAIPTTIVYKVITGKAPFPGGRLELPRRGPSAPTAALARNSAGGQSDVVAVSFALGGCLIGVSRFLSGIVAGLNVAAAGKAKEAIPWLAGFGCLNLWVGYLGTYDNLLLALPDKAGDFGFGRSLAFAQIVFPASATIGFAGLVEENEKVQKAVPYLISVFGALNLAAVVIRRFVDEERQEATPEERADQNVKLSASLLMTAGQTLAFYPTIAKSPTLILVGTLLFPLLGVGTGTLNLERATDALHRDEHFSPI